jgi:hypothetical protein
MRGDVPDDDAVRDRCFVAGGAGRCPSSAAGKSEDVRSEDQAKTGCGSRRREPDFRGW